MRRFVRSAVAHGLARTGADRWMGRISGVASEPLILGYHRVLPDDVTIPTRGVPSMGIRVSTLRRHLEFIARRFEFVSLDEMGARVEAGAASGLAALTFDDGYKDFAENAFPLLQSMGIPAAVFVVTTLLEEGGGFLHDRVYSALDRAIRSGGSKRVLALLAGEGPPLAALPDQAFAATRLLLQAYDRQALTRLSAALEDEFGRGETSPRSLSWDDLIRMSRLGLTVGSHTRTHALLPRETPARVIEETVTSRAEIEARLGVPVSHFVYPDGCFDRAAVQAVAAAGYRFAYTGCKHQDPDHPLLTQARRVFWEGSTEGVSGGFSQDVLSGQLNGIFDRSRPCLDTHGLKRPAPSGTTIAIVAPSLDVPGGQAVQAAALVSCSRQEGIDVSFIATNPRFPRGLRFLRAVPVARTMLNQALYAASLSRLRKADVVHVFSASYWSFLLAPVPAMMVARALGKRVILNYHSGEASDHLKHWRGLVHPWLGLAHRIVVPSPYLRQVFEEHGYRAHVVPNVVDTGLFVYRERGALQPRFLSTRMLEPNYGVDVVVKAFALVKDRYPEATLTITGSGSEEARLRQLAKGSAGITFVGRVRPDRVPALCDGADVFLNAPLVDNQPLSVLEAFASGLPVVTTAAGGIATMVLHGESGLIVPQADAQAMAEAAISLLRDPGLARRIAHGGRKAALAHSWSRVRDQWREMYSGRGADIRLNAIPLAALPEERRC